MNLANHMDARLLEELEALQEGMARERILAEQEHRRAFPENVVTKRRLEIELGMQ